HVRQVDACMSSASLYLHESSPRRLAARLLMASHTERWAALKAARSAETACSGRTPLPRADVCWLGVSRYVESVTQPMGRPMSHPTNSGDARGPSDPLSKAGRGVARPVTCSHRAIASA